MELQTLYSLLVMYLLVNIKFAPKLSVSNNLEIYNLYESFIFARMGIIMFEFVPLLNYLPRFFFW